MTTDTLPLSPVAASRGWARVFATMYDPFLWIGERACRVAGDAADHPPAGHWSSHHRHMVSRQRSRNPVH